MAQTDCRTYLRILLCVSACLCVCARWVNLFSRCPESLNDMLMHSGLIQTTPGKWGMKAERAYFLFSQTSHSSTWIVGCRKGLCKYALSLQEKHTFTFWIMVPTYGYYFAPMSVIHVGKVMIEEQNFTLNLGKIILGGPYQIYMVISLANQANLGIYLLLKVIDSNFVHPHSTHPTAFHIWLENAEKHSLVTASQMWGLAAFLRFISQ